MRDVDRLRVERKSIEVVDLKAVDDSEDLKYWLSKSPIERLQGVEAMRQAMYDYDPVSERLPRFFEIITEA